MVDVSSKLETLREATASGLVRMQPATMARIREGQVAKGDVLGVARLAGIQGAKRTGDLIPLCHPVGLDAVEVAFEILDDRTLRIEATARVRGRTGVEMEALTAVSIAALTVYDMCKSVDRSTEIDSIVLERKSGGRSGDYQRPVNLD
jgi:cyclic pyranopterin monophosphate synthase